jgi:flavin reductase (DIM6/NTAB) family NADH-FMN oxidoreductase RutF
MQGCRPRSWGVAGSIVATGEFVVNVVPFDRNILEKVQITSLSFGPGVDELQIAGLTAFTTGEGAAAEP